MIADIEKTAAERAQCSLTPLWCWALAAARWAPSPCSRRCNHLHYNELPAEKRGGPRLYIEDNIDPERMAALFDVIDVKTTCFNVITKSGGTAETMSQYLIFTDALKKAVGDDYGAKHIITTTGSGSRQPDQARPAKTATSTSIVPNGVGGRFSEMCPGRPVARGGMRHRHPRHARGRARAWISAARAATCGRIPR